MFVKTRRSRMHGTFQVSACPPRVRASNSAVCTRVASLGGRHAHVRCLAERSASRRKRRERGREDEGKIVPCPREDRPLEPRSEEKLAESTTLFRLWLYSHEALTATKNETKGKT